MTKGKPLVVLSGWLGCQKRSLRRYEKFFQTQGYQALLEVASPTMVVGSCLEGLPPLQCPPKWPQQEMNVPRAAPTQDFAWSILQQIHQQNPDHWIFYGFSNGGCFVWESVRKILNVSIEQSTILQDDQYTAIQQLNQSLAGVVFDSCPSRQLSGVGYALQLCSMSERIEVMKAYGVDVAFFPSLMSEPKKEKANSRGQDYFDRLTNDPSPTPQLYLYSENDQLIPSTVIGELVDGRRKVIGPDKVFRKKWTNSRHCAHYIDNPKEYETVVKSFLEACDPKKKTISKL